jgi:sugar diacid utilization regulator
MVPRTKFLLPYSEGFAATVKALFVHRTTLIYRLEKLSGILDTERSFFYLLSCIIARGR